MPTPSPVRKIGQRRRGRLRKRDNLLTGEEKRRGLGEELNHATASLVLYKSFNTLCPRTAS
jgi:hypothetical protein